MGNNCTCFDDLTSKGSEDLSRNGNKEKEQNNINRPKIKLANYSNSEKYDPILSGLNTTNEELNSVNSNQINISKKKKKNNNNNTKIIKSNINNKKNNKNNKNNINSRNNKITSENFEQFCKFSQSQDITKDICLKLHKYFLKILKKKSFLKNIKKYKEEGDKLFNSCVKIIYNSNEILQRSEQSCKIKYSQNGYKQFYPNIIPEEEEKMKYIPDESKTIDNSIIINYQNNENSNESDINGINDISWIYKGQANVYSIPNGYGVKYIKNGIKQEGFWKNGQLIGWSQSIDFQGNILIGPFINGKITGKGVKFSYLNNIFYKGDIVQNKKEGKGEEISSEGNFSGNFVNDKKNGEGKMIFSLSGDIYEGNYKDDLFDGKGHYIWKISGQEYSGEYKNGLMHGKGLYEWSEGEFYRGSFINGKKEGNGEMHWADGRSFIGPFANGRPQGIGIFDNGINYKGEMEFIDGKLNRDYLTKKYRGSESNSLQSSLDKNDSYL